MASALAVIGGGRWGCVTLKVLAKMQLPFEQIIAVSEHNYAMLQDLATELQSQNKAVIKVVPNIDELLSAYPVNTAIVVNASADHFTTALRLIEQGVHVLIEKPVTLSVAHLQKLLAKANEKSVCIMPGLNYRYCQYFKNFGSIVAAQEQQPIAIELDWCDSQNEVRYFDKVTYADPRTDLAQDDFSDAWTIFHIVFNTDAIEIDRCLHADKNRVQYAMRVNSVPTKLAIEHNGQHRRRKLTVTYANAEKFILDFNIEPGIIIANGAEISADPQWNVRSRPLNQEYAEFFSNLTTGQTRDEDAKDALNSVAATALASQLLQAQLVKA